MAPTTRTYHPGNPTTGPTRVTLACGHTRLWDIVRPREGMRTVCPVPGHGATTVRTATPARH